MNQELHVTSAARFRGQRVLVTGGSGFIGTNLVNFLSKETECEILSIDKVPPRNPENIRAHKLLDIMNREALVDSFKNFRPTIVFHLAARTDLDGRTEDDYLENTLGTANVIESILELGYQPNNVLFASSRLVAEIGYQPMDAFDFRPTTPYGRSKVEMEGIIRRHAASRFRWSIFRPTSIWGPWFAVPYRSFFDAVRAGKYLHPGQLVIRKSFGYVGNSVFQICCVATSEANSLDYSVFYLCDYEPLDVYQWASVISSHSGSGVIRRAPLGLLKFAASFGDAVEYVTSKRIKFPITRFRLANLKTPMLHTSWGLDTLVPELPFNLEDGVIATTAWLDRAD